MTSEIKYRSIRTVYPAKPAVIPPAEIQATEFKTCVACGKRPVLPELRRIHGQEKCWECAAK